MHPFIETQKTWLRADLPPFRAGDTLRVNVRVKEGDKERIQAFEGVCISRRGSGVSESFTVQDLEWRWRRAHLSRAQPDDRRHRGGPARPRAPREAVLPAPAQRQGDAHPREKGRTG